jgi:hypothetical protein
MKSHWWWILAAVLLIGGIAVVMFIRSLLSGLRQQILSAVQVQRKFREDIRTGKKPSWLVMDDNEEGGRSWNLSDGTEFNALASTSGDSSKPADISADYEDASLAGAIQYRVRMIAPASQPPTEWTPMKFTPRGPQPDSDDEDAVDDYSDYRYEARIKLDRGKYLVEFQIPNRSGSVEECSGVTLINYDSKDFWDD